MHSPQPRFPTLRPGQPLKRHTWHAHVRGSWRMVCCALHLISSHLVLGAQGLVLQWGGVAELRARTGPRWHLRREGHRQARDVGLLADPLIALAAVTTLWHPRHQALKPSVSVCLSYRLGQLVFHFLRRLSPQEYDQLLQSTPELCCGACPPRQTPRPTCLRRELPPRCRRCLASLLRGHPVSADSLSSQSYTAS